MGLFKNPEPNIQKIISHEKYDDGRIYVEVEFGDGTGGFINYEYLKDAKPELTRNYVRKNLKRLIFSLKVIRLRLWSGLGKSRKKVLQFLLTSFD